MFDSNTNDYGEEHDGNAGKGQGRFWTVEKTWGGRRVEDFLGKGNMYAESYRLEKRSTGTEVGRPEENSEGYAVSVAQNQSWKWPSMEIVPSSITTKRSRHGRMQVIQR